MSKNAGTPKRISIDFDKVIHGYSHGWMDGTIYDVPIPGAIESIKLLQENNYEIVILTAKSNKPDRNKEIRKWLKKYGIKGIKITHTKFPSIAYIDDRAIRFTNWEDIIRYFL